MRIPSKFPWAGGLPHSEIPGSPIARISPGLFAACHVLHRLSVPRHPPDALVSRLINRTAVAGDAAPPPRTGSNPVPVSATAERGGLYEDTSLGQSGQALLAPVCPPRSHHNSLFTLQPTHRGRPRRCRSIFSEHRARLGRTRLAQRTGNTAQCSPAAPVASKTRQNSSFGKARLCRWWR